MTAPSKSLWIDASAGVAGDMLLAALVDVGVPIELIRAAVESVIPNTVRLRQREVIRSGLRAMKVDVELLAADQHHRTWREIRGRIEAANLPQGARARSLAAFAALATAEARVHGAAVDNVHFHEVGGWDSIADMVGVCAAVESLEVGRITVSRIALGSGTVQVSHGWMPVPVPAVAELIAGLPVTAGGDGELATPTGVALLVTLANGSGPLPPMTVHRTGVGAGTKDFPDRANVVRVLLGEPAADEAGSVPAPMVMLETTVDDLDPRVWPAVIDDLLAAGAADAWLTPVLMKKGRPGQVLSVLADSADVTRLRLLMLTRTSTLGVRQYPVGRVAVERAYLDVDVADGMVPVKIGHRSGRILHASPEYEQAAAIAAASGRPVADVLGAAAAAARVAGIVPGAELPPSVRR